MVTQSVSNIRRVTPRRWTVGGLVTAIAVLATALVPVTSSAATGSTLDAGTLVAVEGTLLMLAGQEAAEDHDAHNDEDGIVELTTLMPDQVRLVTDDGVSIPLSGGLPENVETGDSFRGTLSVPAESLRAISETIGDAIVGEAPQRIIAEDTLVGQEIIEASNALDAPLVVDKATIIPETSAVTVAAAHTLDVVVVTRPNDVDKIVVSDTELSSLTGRLSGFWNSQSGGQVASFAITGAVQRIVSANACDAETMWEEAAALYDIPSAIWWMSESRHLLVIAPEACLSKGGLGTLGNGIGGGLAYAPHYAAVFEDVVAHELGHNIGLRHSNTMQCDEATACLDSEYNDYYDIMGGATTVNGAGNAQLPALNVTQKKRLDSFSGGGLAAVSLPSDVTGSSTTFTLNPASSSSGIRGLEITDPNTGAVYYVEYRSGTGIDAGSIYSISRDIAGLGAGLRVLRLRDDDSSAALTLPTSTRTRNLYLAPGQNLTSLGDGIGILFKSSGATAEVVVALGVAQKTMNTGIPTISGTLVNENTLTASTGLWWPTPIDFSHQWLRNGTAIAGGTASTYRLTTADVGAKMSVRVTGTKSGFNTATVSSAATAAVAPTPVPLAAAATPTISGETVEGRQLTANPGAWGPAPVGFAYQWYRNGTSLDWENGSTYNLSAADIGSTFTVAVTGTKTNYITATRTSVATKVITAADKPMTFSRPTLSGNFVEGATITANPGAWGPAPVQLSYQWSRAGDDIAGATASTLKLTAAEVGNIIRVTVTGTKTGYYTTVDGSDFSDLVVKATPMVSATPTISGTVKVGSRLTANAGTWSPAPVYLSYQWLRNGTAISGATSNTYVPTLADVRSKISVKVTGTKSGSASVSRWSASTVTVPLAVQRFGGADRYATAITMSRTFAPGVGVLYVARGSDYPDALSAAPAAAAAGGALLLVTTTEIPAAVKAEIERLKPKKIIVVGSTGSINAAVYTQLAKLTQSITRHGGADRYASSRVIVDAAFGVTGVDRVYLATGRNFPDALSASAAAGANNGAVILVDGSTGTLDAATIALIRKLNPTDIVLAGGPAVLSTGIENSAKALKLPGGTLRLMGPDRFSTSLALNDNAFTTASTVYIATGYNFPDALAGAPLAGTNNAPLYVVPGGCVPKATVAAINEYGATKLVLLGGTSTVSTAVERLAPCAV